MKKLLMCLFSVCIVACLCSIIYGEIALDNPYVTSTTDAWWEHVVVDTTNNTMDITFGARINRNDDSDTITLGSEKDSPATNYHEMIITTYHPVNGFEDHYLSDYGMDSITGTGLLETANDNSINAYLVSPYTPISAVSNVRISNDTKQEKFVAPSNWVTGGFTFPSGFSSSSPACSVDSYFTNAKYLSKTEGTSVTFELSSFYYMHNVLHSGHPSPDDECYLGLMAKNISSGEYEIVGSTSVWHHLNDAEYGVAPIMQATIDWDTYVDEDVYSPGSGIDYIYVKGCMLYMDDGTTPTLFSGCTTNSQYLQVSPP